MPEVGAVAADVDGDRVAIVRDSAATSTRSTTSARTPRSRCPRATSRTAPIECWLHGSRFDLRTGEPTNLPATEPVAVYPVNIDGDDVFVVRRAHASN